MKGADSDLRAVGQGKERTLGSQPPAPADDRARDPDLQATGAGVVSPDHTDFLAYEFSRYPRDWSYAG